MMARHPRPHNAPGANRFLGPATVSGGERLRAPTNRLERRVEALNLPWKPQAAYNSSASPGGWGADFGAVDQGDCGLNTEYLRYFELAYMEGNFSAAARRVPVSPQGLTKAIHTLEKDLGVPLFNIDEATGTPVPTDYAHELFQYAQVFDSNTHLLQSTFDSIRGGQRSTIRLACSLGVLGAFGPEFLERFGQLHPNIDFDYWEASDALVARALQKGECGLALLVGQVPQGVRASELYRCRQYFWVGEGSPLAGRESLCLPDIAGCDVAIPGSGFDCYRRLMEGAEQVGARLGHVYQMSEIFQLYEFAASGRGVGFSVEHLVNLPIFARDRRAVPVVLEGAQWRFSIACLDTHALDDAEQAFWTYCQASAKDLGE